MQSRKGCVLCEKIKNNGTNGNNGNDGEILVFSFLARVV